MNPLLGILTGIWTDIGPYVIAGVAVAIALMGYGVWRYFKGK